jgi:hypothetical protein
MGERVLMALNGSCGTCRWLSHWSTQPSAADEVFFYLGIYAALGGASTVFVFVRSLLSAVGGLNAAKALHDQLVQRVRGPPSFAFTFTCVVVVDVVVGLG